MQFKKDNTRPSKLKIKIISWFSKIKKLSKPEPIYRNEISKLESSVTYFTYSKDDNAEVFTTDFSNSEYDIIVWCNTSNFVGQKIKANKDAEIYPVRITK